MTFRRGNLAILAFAVAMAGIPLFVHSSHWLSLLVFIGIQTIVVIGLCLLMGYAGQVSLGQAAFYGLGAYTSAVLTVKFGVSPWGAMLAGILFTGTVAYVIGVPIFRLRGHYLAMATLGFGVIVQLAFSQLRDLTGGSSGLPGVPRLAIGEFVFKTDLSYYYLVWTVVLLVLFLSLNIVNSRVGRALRSLHGSEVAAEMLGVDTGGYKLQVLVLSAVFASIAGSLYAHYMIFVSPMPFGFIGSMELVTMAAVGGLSSIWGAPFGAGAVFLLREALRSEMSKVLHYAGGEYQLVVYGVLLVIIMIFAPEGLTNRFVTLVRRWNRRHRVQTKGSA
jgi:branched-chain amino acid transport system permease protein